MKRAMSRKPRRFALSGQDSHALEPRHLLTAVNVGSLTGVLPPPNHVGLTIGHVVAPATHGHISAGVRAAATAHVTHAAVQHPERHATANHPTATHAETVAAPESTTNHIGAATSFHVGAVKDAATGLTFYRTQSKNPATGRVTPTSTPALAVTHQVTALATPTAVSPNADSCSSVCAQIPPDRAAYEAALAAYNSAASSYHTRLGAYYSHETAYTTKESSLKSDVSSLSSKYGAKVTFGPTTELDPSTGKLQTRIKLEVDLTGVIQRLLGAARKEKASLKTRGDALNADKAQLDQEAQGLRDTQSQLDATYQQLLNEYNALNQEQSLCACDNFSPESAPTPTDPPSFGDLEVLDLSFIDPGDPGS